jgi:heptosyltransferase-2
MSLKAQLFEAAVWVAGKSVRSDRSLPDANRVRSIFVLRNGDIGDLLATTPLFAALRGAFPEARIVAGVSSRTKPVLDNNPHLSEVWDCNAPWHNHTVTSVSPTAGLRYIAKSEESKRIADAGFDIGIDIFGSNFGMLLLVRGRVPYRIGVRGFRGGHTAAQWCVDFTRSIHVSRANLRVAEHLGVAARDLPPSRPQLFLTDDERAHGQDLVRRARRDAGAGDGAPCLVVCPGAGDAEKCWPAESFAAVARRLGTEDGVVPIIVGGNGDVARGERIAAESPNALDLTGRLTLRETFAVVAAADLALCNSSMVMHAAAAFQKPTVTLLSPLFEPAAEHAALWGYPDACVVLGRGNCAGDQATVDEAYQAVVSMLRSPSGAPLVAGRC